MTQTTRHILSFLFFFCSMQLHCHCGCTGVSDAPARQKDAGISAVTISLRGEVNHCKSSRLTQQILRYGRRVLSHSAV